MSSLQLRKVFTSRLVRPLALLAITALAAPGPALAANNWSSVGSTGIVDELCYTAIQMNNSEAQLFPGVPFPCTIRYQVTDTFPGGGTPNHLALFANIRDMGAGNVVVTLRQYPINGSNPVGTVVRTIDSNVGGTPTAAGFKSYRDPASSPGCGFALDFTLNTYWIEVVMTPGLPPTVPGLAIGALKVGPCS